MDTQTFFVFEFPMAEEDKFWIAYKCRQSDKITGNVLIRTFLRDYIRAKRKKIDLKSVSLFALSEKYSNNFIIIQNLDTDIRTLKNTEFCVTFSPIPEEPIYAKKEIVSKMMDNGFYFYRQKKYYSSIHFFQHIETYGLIEITRICYHLQQSEYLKKIMEAALAKHPNDYELIKMAGDFYEQIGETNRSLKLYKKYRLNFPIFNVIYHRISLLREKQRYVDDIINDALLDIKTQNYDLDLLFECAKLRIKNNQLQEACKLCLLNHDFLLKCIEYFTTVPNLPKIYRHFVCEQNLPPVATANIAQKLFKFCEVKNSLKLAEFLFQNNRYNFFCVLVYMDLLLKSYEYERLVDVITLFFTILPKKLGKFDVEKIADNLQNTSTFRKKTFSPYFSPDFEYCEFDFEKEDEINLRLNSKIQGNTGIKHIDLNKIVDELCNEENIKCFEIIIMVICVFFFLIGDIATFKNFVSSYGAFVTFDSNSIPFMFYEVQQLYQSAVNIKNSAFPLMSSSLNMLAVGDVHSISSCNTKVFIQNQGYYITSLPVTNLSIYDLRMDSRNYRKEMFFRFIRKAEQFQRLMIVLGTKDCERVIPKMTQKMVFSMNPTLAAIQKIVDIYVEVLDDIESSLPTTAITVHCALARFSWSIPIVERFNIELFKKIRGKFPFISPFPARSVDNFFNVIGYSDSVPDAKYPINLNAILNKVSHRV